jgi:uncharacterized protein YbaR (Trm112 family)
MISDELLPLLRCFMTGSRLRVASPAICRRLNQAITRGELFDAGGRLVRRPIQGGLVNADASVFYPLHDEVLQLLQDEVIPLTQPAVTPQEDETG